MNFTINLIGHYWLYHTVAALVKTVGRALPLGIWPKDARKLASDGSKLARKFDLQQAIFT